jgi:hypothetical protein
VGGLRFYFLFFSFLGFLARLIVVVVVVGGDFRGDFGWSGEGIE